MLVRDPAVHPNLQDLGDNRPEWAWISESLPGSSRSLLWFGQCDRHPRAHLSVGQRSAGQRGVALLAVPSLIRQLIGRKVARGCEAQHRGSRPATTHAD